MKIDTDYPRHIPPKQRKTPRYDWHTVIADLGRKGIGFKVHMSGQQIKCGSVNFYPSTGSIFIDGGGKALPQKGYEAFVAVIKERRHGS